MVVVSVYTRCVNNIEKVVGYEEMLTLLVTVTPRSRQILSSLKRSLAWLLAF